MFLGRVEHQLTIVYYVESIDFHVGYKETASRRKLILKFGYIKDISKIQITIKVFLVNDNKDNAENTKVIFDGFLGNKEN